MNQGTISWLTTCPASDVNFKSHLKNASDEEVRKAISILATKEKSASKISALWRELRKRNK